MSLAAPHRAGRLTDAERAEREMTGAEVQVIVTGMLEVAGFAWCHFRALQNRRGFWQVPVEGPLGTGWPDLFAVGRGRAIAIELKRQTGDPVTPDQERVHALLRAGGIPVHVVRPSDVRAPLEATELWRELAR